MQVRRTLKGSSLRRGSHRRDIGTGPGTIGKIPRRNSLGREKCWSQDLGCEEQEAHTCRTSLEKSQELDDTGPEETVAEGVTEGQVGYRSQGFQMQCQEVEFYSVGIRIRAKIPVSAGQVNEWVQA
jgi:hypothetical protein